MNHLSSIIPRNLEPLTDTVDYAQEDWLLCRQYRKEATVIIQDRKRAKKPRVRLTSSHDGSGNSWSLFSKVALNSRNLHINR